MPAAKVKQYVQATRDPKSLHAPLHKANDKNTGVGESLVDTLAAEESDDEEAVEYARCAGHHRHHASTWQAEGVPMAHCRFAWTSAPQAYCSCCRYIVFSSLDPRFTNYMPLRRTAKASVDQLLSTLHPRERNVLRFRYGILPAADGMMTLNDIGKLYDLKGERIRQIELRALSRLRRPERLQALQHFQQAQRQGTAGDQGTSLVPY